MAERLWQMTKLGDGDWILLSNDRTKFHRFVRYPELGTLEDEHGNPIEGDRWAVFRFNHHPETIAPEDLDVNPWWDDVWTELVIGLRTRQACINYTLEQP